MIISFDLESQWRSLEVTGGHCRSLEVSGRVTNWAKTQKKIIFKENSFGNFYFTLNLLSNGINQFFSYKMLTTSPISTIFGMHTHISLRYNI